ncbi:hypothetical protein HAX54_050573 [Datura stramonium]|uniref:Homeobox-leucine zipper protein n=1 Tax=Datura stramonium TaxID=4076 RepID=A0ABS8SWZ0_DATST|nr:hypothetical protein [Datura stramonium]
MTGSKVVDDQMALSISEVLSSYLCTTSTRYSTRREAKPRRRRKKKKAEGSNNNTSTGDQQKLETERKAKLASELGLDPQQVAGVVPNRRARWKLNKKLEEEYSKLKSENEAVIIEKICLETEMNQNITNGRKDKQSRNATAGDPETNDSDMIKVVGLIKSGLRIVLLGLASNYEAKGKLMTG